MVAEIISELEKKHSVVYESIADLGSGPACLARILHEQGRDKKVDCVDGMAEMIELGKERCGKEDVRNVQFHHAHLWKTGLQPKAYELVSCNNALQYNDQAENRDIERIVIESNRLLKEKGYLILALIPSTKPRDIQNLSQLIGRYGFTVNYADKAEVTGVDELSHKKRKTAMPVIVARKDADYSGEFIGEILPVYSPRKYAATGGQRQLTLFPPETERRMRRSTLTEKVYTAADGRQLVEVVRGWG